MNTLRFLITSLSLLLCLPALAGKKQQLSSPGQVPEGLEKSDWASIRAAHTAWQHGFIPIDDGWQARNPGQQWTTKFDEHGFLTTPREGDWTWGLALESYGRGGKQQKVSGKPGIKAEGQRLSYQWDATLEEWWVNDQRGLEHGYTVARRPEGAEGSVLELKMATRGTLKPSVSEDALGVLFVDDQGTTVLTYSGLKVWDADGKTIASRFETAGGNQVRLLVEEQGARYPLTIDPIAQQAYLKPADNGPGGVNDLFGGDVAVSGDTVVVGAQWEDSGTTGINSTPDESASDSGAAYVFVRSGTTWSQQAYLKASQVNVDDYFGKSVAVSGDTVVVGAYNEDSSTTGINSTPNENSSNVGAAYVFVRSGAIWSQQAYLKASISDTRNSDAFGISVAVSGDTVVVGAAGEDSSTTGIDSTPNELASGAGAAYVFARSGTTWSPQAYLKASNTGVGDDFGLSVSVSGDTVVVGARYEDSSTTGVNSTPNESASDSGATYVFARSGTTWSQQAYLKPAAVGTTQASDNFGGSVAVSGDTVVVGAPNEDSSTTGINSTPNESASDSGATYVFARSGTTWSQQAYLKPAAVGTAQAGDQFGWSVSVSGNTVVVGAYGEDSSTTGINSISNENASGAGAAYVFVRSGVAWSEQAYIKPAAVGTTQQNDSFGFSVAVAGDTVVVGARDEDSTTRGINGTPGEGVSNSGAAYIFDLGTSTLVPEIAIQQMAVNLASGTTKDFGSVSVSGTADLVFDILNTGTGDLTLSGSPKVAVSGSSDFSVTAQPASPISAGGGSNFTVRFAPASTGMKAASLTILNNDADEGTYVINLTGMSPSTDTDGDGWSDGAETEFGGNAAVAGIVPQFRLAISPDTAPISMRLRFPAAPGSTHAIEGSVNLIQWQEIETGILGSGQVIERTLPMTGLDKRFFKIRKN